MAGRIALPNQWYIICVCVSQSPVVEQSSQVTNPSMGSDEFWCNIPGISYKIRGLVKSRSLKGVGDWGMFSKTKASHCTLYVWDISGYKPRSHLIWLQSCQCFLCCFSPKPPPALIQLFMPVSRPASGSLNKTLVSWPLEWRPSNSLFTSEHY